MPRVKFLGHIWVIFGNAYDEEQAGCISEASNDVKEGAALLAMNFLCPEDEEGALVTEDAERIGRRVRLFQFMPQFGEIH